MGCPAEDAFKQRQAATVPGRAGACGSAPLPPKASGAPLPLLAGARTRFPQSARLQQPWAKGPRRSQRDALPPVHTPQCQLLRSPQRLTVALGKPAISGTMPAHRRAPPRPPCSPRALRAQPHRARQLGRARPEVHHQPLRLHASPRAAGSNHCCRRSPCAGYRNALDSPSTDWPLSHGYANDPCRIGGGAPRRSAIGGEAASERSLRRCNLELRLQHCGGRSGEALRGAGNSPAHEA